MRKLTGEQILVRIFFGEAEKWHGHPMEVALLERLRKEGFAGATAFRGIAGFGPKSILHTSHILRLSEDLPIVVEIVDTEDHIEQKLMPILDGMLGEGLVTREKVQVVRYGK